MVGVGLGALPGHVQLKAQGARSAHLPAATFSKSAVRRTRQLLLGAFMGPMPALRPLAKLRAFGAHCFTLVALLAATALAATAALGIPAASANSRAAPNEPVNAPPQVQPSLQHWQGGVGTVTVGPATKILVDQRYARSLSPDASVFAQDVQSVTDLKMPVAVSPAAEPGDFFLTLGSSGAGSPGYRLDLGNAGISIAGQTSTGVFYGEQTILQMLRLSSSGRSLPQGTAADSPDYSYRGVMLDSGRKYWSVAYIQRLIRQMAWLKLNTLHWHLAEWNAFRLNSPEYPGLAAPQSYTKADVDAVLATARRYHVTVIPEVDVPAHDTELTAYNPSLRWSCRAMNDSPWARNSGWTVDITKPENVAWLDKMLTTFMSWFPGKYFHFGTDEYQMYEQMITCPELVNYAQSHGFASPADVFVAFDNHVDQLAKSHGKKAVIWNYWDARGHNTITPAKDITIEAWTASPDNFATAGYDTIGAPGGTVYITPQAPPGNNSTADPGNIYEDWTPSQDPHVQGYELPVWADLADTQPDAYFDWFLRRPEEALAARLWGGPRAKSVFAFEDELARIGVASGITPYTPAGSLLAGSPYGNGDGASSAFDGDPATATTYAQADGGYVGIDLGPGHANRITAIRFVPAADTTSSELQMVGGQFQGCTDGPDTGCHDLAAVKWRPVWAWNELTVTDRASYRWLRYVSPAGSHDNVGEIQFYGAPVADPLSMAAPPELSVQGHNNVETTFTNPSDKPIHDLKLCVMGTGQNDFTPLPAVPQTSGGTPEANGCAGPFPAIPPQATVRVNWDIKVPMTAEAGSYTFYAKAAWPDGQNNSASLQTATDVGSSSVPQPVTPAPATSPISVEPGSINMEPGVSATTSLQITSQSAAPASLTWTANPPTGSGVSFRPASGQIRLPAFGKTAASLHLTATTPGVFAVPVTLTTETGAYAGSVTLHVRAAYPDFGAAFNDVGITDDADVAPPDLGVGLGGNGASFSAQELATHGLTPGATFNYKGFAFPWPDAAPGHPDNVVADGQTITLHGQGAALGLLATGTPYFTPPPINGIVTYTDGTVQQFTLAVPNWRAAPPSASDPAINTSYHNAAGYYNDKGSGHGTAYIYLVTVPLDPAKKVASVTLPVVPDYNPGGTPTINVFSMAIQ